MTPQQAPDAPPHVPGYVLSHVIGRGATASVWAGTRDFHGTRAAVKVFNAPVRAASEARAFLQECRTTARFATHPAVVQLENFGFLPGGGADGNRPFLATRLYERGSLAAQLLAHGHFTTSMALDVAVVVAGACATAHEAGVLHNDIKPANLFVTDLDDVVLGDFGVAGLVDHVAGPDDLVGYTRAYAAPELVAGGDPSPRTDVYALGATLKQMLTGAGVESPWPAETPMAAREVTDRALAHDPAQRYASMRSFGEALRSTQQALGLTPTPLKIGALLPPDLSTLDPAAVGWTGGAAGPAAAAPALAPAWQQGPPSSPPGWQQQGPPAWQQGPPAWQQGPPSSPPGWQQQGPPASPPGWQQQDARYDPTVARQPGGGPSWSGAPGPQQWAAPGADRQPGVPMLSGAPPKPGRSRVPLIVAGVVVLVLAVGGGGAALVLNSSGKSTTTSLGTSTTTPTAGTTGTTGTAGGTTAAPGPTASHAGPFGSPAMLAAAIKAPLFYSEDTSPAAQTEAAFFQGALTAQGNDTVQGSSFTVAKVYKRDADAPPADFPADSIVVTVEDFAGVLDNLEASAIVHGVFTGLSATMDSYPQDSERVGLGYNKQFNGSMAMQADRTTIMLVTENMGTVQSAENDMASFQLGFSDI